MNRFFMAVFPVDFESKYKEFICKDENVNIDNFDEIYGEYGFEEFCQKVSGKTLQIKMDGVNDCFEVEDNNWCVPLSLIEVID